jgi:hypothetical protein
MKRRTFLILILLAVLLVSAAAVTRGVFASRTGTPPSGYTLNAPAWQVSGSSQANGYHLRSYTPLAEIPHGCCCYFLPCLFK